MDTGTRTFAHRLARRLPIMMRAAFYAITVSAAILAVLATSAGGPEGVMLMELSWYMVMLSFLAFLLMVLVNVLSGHAVADEEVRASRTHSHSPLPGASFASRGAQPESQAPRIVAFDDSPRPTPAPAPYP